MRASDFITQIRSELQEKGGAKHWKDEELFVMLQRVYGEMQDELPYFVSKEVLAIEEGKESYRLKHEPVKNVVLRVDGVRVPYSDPEYFYAHTPSITHTFEEKSVMLGFSPTKACDGEIVYKYKKRLETINCVIELPTAYYDGLGKLFKSKIHEKPVLNSKERNLSAYYLKLYEQAVMKLKLRRPARAKNVTTKYKVV